MAEAVDPLAPFYVQRSDDEWLELARAKTKEAQKYYGNLFIKYWNKTDRLAVEAVRHDHQYRGRLAGIEENLRRVSEADFDGSSRGYLVKGNGDVGDYSITDTEAIQAQVKQDREAAEFEKTLRDRNLNAWKQEYAYAEAVAAKEAKEAADRKKQIDDANTNAEREQDFWLHRRQKNRKSDGSGSGGLYGGGANSRDVGDMRSLLGIYAETTDRSQSGLGI